MAFHGPWPGNLGYIAFGTEATDGVAVTPSTFAFLDNETLMTDPGLEDQMPIAGIPIETYQVLQGLRTHKGDIEIVAEPNTALELVDMLMTRGTSQVFYTFTVTSANATIGATYTNNTQTFTVVATIAAQTTLICTGTGAPLASGTLTKATGTGDATITFSANVAGNTQWPFTLSGATTPNSKTIDISLGSMVKRYVGCQASKIVPNFQKNLLNLKASISALGSFQGAVIASVTGSGPYTVNFNTTWDTSPTSKLVVGDLIRFYHPGGTSFTDATIASLPTAASITTSTNVSAFVAGDMMVLRPQTISYTVQSPFLWGNTWFCFGATAAAALAAAQTQVEQGSTWEVDYGFESDDGSHRSGNFDPAALNRMLAKTSLNIKKFFDTPDDIINMNGLTKTACVIRHFSPANSTGAGAYELRITMNHLVTSDPLPKIKSKAINYEDIKYHPQFDATDQQEFDIKIIASVSSIG